MLELPQGGDHLAVKGDEEVAACVDSLDFVKCSAKDSGRGNQRTFVFAEQTCVGAGQFEKSAA